jgi:hypothetical protein
MTALIIVLIFIADRLSHELLGGGWLVMQIASLGSTTADVFAVKALQIDG